MRIARLCTALGAVSGLGGVSAASLFGQQPLGLSAESSPEGITQEVHTVIHAPHISQDHKIRIKRSEHFCNDSATLYTGYLDAPSRHLFFWFSESRRDPDKDDLMLWTNGQLSLLGNDERTGTDAPGRWSWLRVRLPA